MLVSYLYIFPHIIACQLCDWFSSVLKKNLNASKPSEHPSSGEKMSKVYLGGNIGCRDETSSWHLNGFPDGTVVTSGQQYNLGEKSTVILYTYINRHAGTPKPQQPRNSLGVQPGYSNMVLEKGEIKLN